MRIASHNSQHEAAEELPLISDAATITGIEIMDQERREDVIDAVKLLLEVYNEEDWLDGVNGADDIDWTSLREVLGSHTESDTEQREDVLSTKLDTLQNRYEREHPMLVSIRFQTDDSFDFVPGQYVTLRYEETARTYSIASSPNNDETELCIRRVPGGTLTPKLCETLSVGDEISIRGPNGDFTLTEPSEQHLVFIATGTGVAPFKSMIKYTFEEDLEDGGGDSRDVWLFLGASWKDDLPYRETFQTLDEEHENFHFVPTLTREKYLSRWGGETAYVQQTLMKYFDSEAVDASDLSETVRPYLDEPPVTDIDARLDPDTMETYACGLNAMVFSLLDAVKATGVSEKKIEAEGYG